MSAEEIGVIAVRQYLLQSGYFETTDVKDGDRTISWDGEIRIYKTPNTPHKKADFFDKLPIQIKTRKSKSPFKSKILIPMDVADLRNYRIDGGVLLWVCHYESATQTQLYYRFLDIIDLDIFLGKTANGDGKITIDKIFEVPSIIEFETKCHDFLRHRKLLRAEYRLTLAAAESKDFELNILPSYDKDFKLKREEIVYARDLKSSIPVLIPINEKIEVAKPQRFLSATVKCDNKIFYTGFTCTYLESSCDMEIIFFGNKITVANRKLEFQYKPRLLNQAIMSAEFLRAVAKCKSLEFEGLTIFELSPDKKMEESVESSISFLNDMKRVLDMLDFQDDIEIKNMTAQERQDFRDTADIMLRGKMIPIDPKSSQLSRISCLQIGGKKFILHATVENCNIVKIESIFAEGLEVVMTVQEPYEQIRIPLPLTPLLHEVLDAENWNIEKFDTFLDSVESTQNNESLKNLLMLKAIKEFDRSKDGRRLKLAEIILKNTLESDIKTINFIQIQKRLRQLTVVEIKQIKQILGNTDKPEIKVGCYILLDKKQEARKILSEFDQETQKAIMGWPIYNLL